MSSDFQKNIFILFNLYFCSLAFSIELYDSPTFTLARYGSCRMISQTPMKIEKIGSISHYWVSKPDFSDSHSINLSVVGKNEKFKFTLVKKETDKKIAVSPDEGLALQGFLSLNLVRGVRLGECLNGHIPMIFVDEVELKNGLILSSKEIEQGIRLQKEINNQVVDVRLENLTKDLSIKILNRGAALADYESILDPSFVMSSERFSKIWKRSKWEKEPSKSNFNQMANKESFQHKETTPE